MNKLNNTQGSYRWLSQQRGATLIVCLIILAIITILGVGSIQNTSLEEKMAGNMQSRNAAFQAAETAIRDAENRIQNLVGLDEIDGTGGMLREIDAEPADYMAPALWVVETSEESVSLDQSLSAPRYVIKHVEERVLDTSKKHEVGASAGSVVSIFKITARGTGGDGSAVVVLQTYYGKKF